MAYNFSKRADTLYGILHNTADPKHEWQLYQVDVTTGAEKLVTAVDLAPSTARLASFSIHPDGRRALTTVAKFPFQIWTLEGFEPRANNWFTALAKRR